ncbi:MAG: SpoIID/LytB domain-containing protein [Cyanobacteria bacterium J06628_4]
MAYMRLKSSRVASLVLSGVIAVTGVAGVGRPIAKAEAAPAAATASTSEKIKQPSQNTHSQPALPKASPEPKEPNPKIKKSSTTPEPIEPFIRADAVALGQWLMIKSVKSLVAKPATATKPATAAKPAKPATAAAGGTTTTSSEASAAAQTAQPPAPKVNVSAVPPKPSNNATIDSYTEMRVALTKQASSVTVAASEGGVLVSANGELMETLPAGVGYQVSADDRSLLVNGQPVPTAVWLETDNGYVAVGERWYRGRLLLLWQDGGVMAVNHVLLRDYLYSVVGAEMSASWSLEALKAQAVAARSYAIVHTVRHQRRAYDLDDTQRYQAYKGIRTEASSTHQAVHDTAGEFISYGGGVVESLYAANQAIVDDAHSGYGMSQTGALDLAQQGYRYYEILSAYYPETSVGRIDISN